MLPGVFPAVRKDGTPYYRASLTYRGKHISLGSYESEESASRAYEEGRQLLSDPGLKLSEGDLSLSCLPFERAVILLNFRDNGLFFKTPIYLRANYFEYYLTEDLVLKFDIDDLFFYAGHKLQRRGGHLFVSEYGMQTGILSRYGIRPHAVAGTDYLFVNGDPTDYRYSNIRIINEYCGVEKVSHPLRPSYRTRIHINGNYLVGTYDTPEEAAIAYNKAADLAKEAGVPKSFPQNYVEKLSPKEYAEIYTALPLSPKYLSYLNTLKTEKETGC